MAETRQAPALTVGAREYSAATAPLSEPQGVASSTSFDGARVAVSPRAESARKGFNEWASPRSLGRGGTPPPVPRRASHNEGDGPSAEDLLPRTPAQVLASRAQAAKPTTREAAADGVDDADASSGSGSSNKSDGVLVEPESSTSSMEEEVKMATRDVVQEISSPSRRRTSRQQSAVSSEGDDGEHFRRDERVDTSTVDEESMCNDDDDVDEEEDGEEEHDGEYGEHESVGTSDEYVNIHEEEQDGEGDDGEEDEEQEYDEQQQRYHRSDESLTPDSTPPPSPPRLVRPPPPLMGEWTKYVAESGHEYYFNTRTQASQWTRPDMMLSPRAAPAQQEEREDEEDDDQRENQVDFTCTALQLPAQVPVYVASESRASATPSSYLESLFVAVSKNDETAQLQSLIGYDIDVNTVNVAGLTPLHVAVQHGNARGAAMLLEYGALVDGPVDTSVTGILGTYSAPRAIETPLVMACRTNHASLVRLLVRYGASIYTRDLDGNSLLHIAIRCWSDEVLTCLLEIDSVAAIINLRNTDDETPLHLAARHGNANAVRALVASGASTDAEDAQGRTPLIVSIMENRIDCAQQLQTAVYAAAQGGLQHGMADSSGEKGPAMYDAQPMNVDEGRHTSDEVEGLRTYLMQLLQHTSIDAVLLSTVYQYMDSTQRDFAAMASTQAEGLQREDNLLSQIDQLTNNESVAVNELAKEREENERFRQQLESKEIEMQSLQAAYESLSSRSAMLESIARSSQDKLRRERAEFARQEEYWNQTIENSLRENAALLESVQALQQGWQAQTIHEKANDLQDSSAEQVHQEVYEDTYDSSQYQQGHEDQYQQTYNTHNDYYAANAYDQGYNMKQSGEMYEAADRKGVTNVTSASTPSAKSEPERPISPERVDAVWNRFFENVSRVADADAPAQPQRSSTLSSRQGAAPVSMLPPASSVFDSIRKDKKDRLHHLLLSGISPNIRDIGEKGTPLHLASELGDLEAVMLLCEFGADVEIRDENGNTALLLACSQGHYDCTKFLLQSAANQAALNSSRDTALHLAAWDGSFECVEILLEYGVDVLSRNSLGLTALSNLQTRSPLRHRFDELADNHPMTKILQILEEAERAESDEPIKEPPKSMHMASARAVVMKGEAPPKPPLASNVSWGRWILGSVFGSGKASAPAEPSDVSDDDDSKSDFEEAQSSPLVVDSPLLYDYEDLHPPPEIEAELRRKPLSPSSSSLPPPPPEVLDALKQQKLAERGGIASPSHSATRFASPASVSAVKRPLSITPSSVRSRYVDTFNHP